MDEMAEEHAGDEGLLADATTDKGALTKASVSARLKALKAERKTLEPSNMAAEMRLSYGDDGDQEKESALLEKFLLLTEEEATLKAGIRQREQALETAVIRQYPRLSIEEIKLLVVEKKWMAALESRIAAEVDAISYRLTERIRELAERYEMPLPQLAAQVSELKSKVEQHLEKMGYTWN
jgi:type I restriction enzyme M protein